MPPKAKEMAKAKPKPTTSNNMDVTESSSDEGENSPEKNTSADEDDGGFRFGDIYIPVAPPPACALNDGSRPRTIITHIENIDFKSYAGKQVLGPFHKSFTAIVGPNGSGKSNVIDSMLFVFGYRAAKIRSKKLSVLIHKSEQRNNVRSCTVTVHFQQIIDMPGEDYEVVPNSKFSITRTAYQDSSSFYLLNDRKVLFKEISKLLLSHGIDLDHNRFLILQGEVEQISMMKPMAATEHECGMLEYLEDIVGTTRYKEPIEKLFGRVEKLNEERSDKIERVKMAEKEKDALEGPKNEAIEYLKNENEKTEVDNFQAQRYLLEQQSLVEEKRQERKALEDALQKVKEELKVIQEQKDELNNKIKEASKFLDAANQTKDKKKAQFDKANARDVNLQADVVQTSKQRKKTKELLSAERKKLIDLEQVPEKNAKDIEELEVRLQTLTKTREKEEVARDKLMEGIAVETKGLQESKEKLETQLIGLKHTVTETNSANCIAKKELDLYMQDEQRQQTKLEQIQANYKNTCDIVNARKKEIVDLEKKIPEVETQLQGATEEIRSIMEERNSVGNQLRKQRMDVEESRSTMQATRSKGKVLDFLMNQKQQGILPGVFGRLGDLGAIDQKYDIAISTACGALDHILVDTKETGEKCINLLKTHDIGRASFIILDKQEHLRPNCDTRMNYPEGVPRLYDLIRVQDERVRTAFYFAIRETLVSNDLDQASRIAYGATRYRVVSLKGEIIEVSGTMSGGGRPSRGRMGQSIVTATNVATPGQIEKMERKLNELETRSRQLQERHDVLQPLVQQLPVQLKKMKMDLKKYVTERASAVENEPILKEQLKKQEQALKAAAPNPTEVKRMEAIIKKTQAAYDKAFEAAELVNSEVKKLHKQIVEKSGGKMLAAQKKLDEISKNIDKVRKEKTKLSVAIGTSKRDVKKSNEKIANMEQEIKDAETALIAMQKEIQDVTEEGKRLIAEIEGEVTEILEREEVLTTMKEKLKVMNEKEQAKKTSKLEVSSELDSFNNLVSNFESRVKVQKRKLASLKLHRIPGEETVGELKNYTPEELNGELVQKMQYRLSLVEEKLACKKPNFTAIDEFMEREGVYMKRVKELEELTTQRNEMRAVVEDLRKRRLDEFMTGFSIITYKLKETYQMITLGGDAELELVDSLDPFREGIIFSVRPPKKSWKNISNLSGGEKTLSSLALVFALHYYKPSPLYVMDEIDAALDFKNVSIVGHYIKERTRNAQFIIISLRANMFELADRLVGIYKTYNATKSATINPKLYGKQAKQPSQPALRQQVEPEETAIQPVLTQQAPQNVLTSTLNKSSTENPE